MNRDLIALVADIQQEKTLETLLHKRQLALHIRPITFDILRHPRKDPGVYQEAAEFLRSYATRYTHALVLLDHAWQGVPGNAQTIARTIREELHRSSAAIFQALARKVSLTRCQDQAFALLRETLAQWFPQP